MEAVRTTCPYCGVGCGVLARRSAEGAVEIAGDPEHPANFGRLCSKGAALAETLGEEGRLLHPELKSARVDWEAALDLVAARFAATLAEHGPGSVAFYVSGQLLTEDYYVANKLMKGFLGAAAIDTNSRLCMSSAVAAMQRAFGADHMPVGYADLEAADLVVLWGSNLAWCHPVLFQRLAAAKRVRPGLKVVVVDPRRTATCELADLHLPLLPGTDGWLLNGLLVHLEEAGCRDTAFVASRTEGLEATLAAARASSPDISNVARTCGLDPAAVAQLYAWYAAHARTVTLWSQGLNQSSSGTDKGGAIINLHLLTGRIGRPGAGPFSITGQPNAMGGREVGGLATQLAAHVGLDESRRAELVRAFWGALRVPDGPGPKAVDLFHAVGDGRVKALWIMATNPAATMPDADAVRAAIGRCPFVVVSDCVRRTDTTRLADLLLPAAAWGEKDGTVTNSERRISRQRPFLPLPGEARPDWWIVSEVARRMGFGAAFPYCGPADIFREHCRLAAAVGSDLGLGPLGGLSDADYDALAPVRWPLDEGSPIERHQFFHDDGRARFVAVTPRPPSSLPDAATPFTLNTGRYRDHWHTLTRTGRSPTLSRHRPAPLLELAPADAVALGLDDGDWVRVLGRTGGAMVLRAAVDLGLVPGQVFAPLHWTGEDAAAARPGALVAPAVDPISGQPELKTAPVAVERLAPAWTGFALLAGPAAPRPPQGDGTWWSGSRVVGGRRLELAGAGPEADWRRVARAVLGPAQDGVEYRDAGRGVYRAAVLRAGRLAACLFVGGEDIPPAALLAGLGRGRMEPRDLLALLAGAASAEDPGPLLCACFGVGRRAIEAAVGEGRANCVDSVGALLKAGTNCGSCLPELEALLAASRPKPAALASRARATADV